MRGFSLLGLMLLTAVGLSAQTVHLVAYWVRPDQIEAAADMTAEDSIRNLTALWTESASLASGSPVKLTHETEGRSATLQIEATAPAAGSSTWRLSLMWAEKVKPVTGPERQRSLNTILHLAPGSAQVLARNLSQAITAAEQKRGTAVGPGIVYVLSVQPAVAGQGK